MGHKLWCSNVKLGFTVAEQPVFRAVEEGDEGVLLQVMKIPSVDSSAPYETTLWDTACSGLFVRNAHAREKGFTSRNKRLKVVTLGGEIKEMDTVIFDCKIKDLRGNFYEFQAHGLDEVTGALNTDLGKELMERLFPGIIGGFKMCGASVVDYLIGLSKASWQPVRTLKAEEGGDFWIWENRFGSCVGGSHPLVGNHVPRSENLFTVLKAVDARSVFDESTRLPTCSAFKTKISTLEVDDFFQVERLCTTVEPKCGACRCGKCPVPGSRYSFKKETELKLIEEGLRYNEANNRWIAQYPYLFPREPMKGTVATAGKSTYCDHQTSILFTNSKLVRPDWISCSRVAQG